jgi:hypothetical protein
MLEIHGDPSAPMAHAFAADLVAAGGSTGDAWSTFLFWDTSMPQVPYDALAPSYFAPGPSHVAVRSNWQKDAVWGTFVAGAYIDAPDSGEQYFNQGAIAVVQGDQPILVNATGWLPQAAGDSGETFVYDDTWGSRTRLLNNTFYAAGAKQDGAAPGDSKTHIQHFEDWGALVHAQGVSIADMYTGGGVKQFTRDYVYVRPGTFVVYDRTTTDGGDQWLAWHTPSAPQQATVADATQRRYDVLQGGNVLGSVRSLLPRSSNPKTMNLVGGAAYRLEMHAPTTAGTQDWLTTVTAGGTVPEQTRLSTDDGNVLSGTLVGVHVQSAREAVVLFTADHAGTATTSSASYVVAQNADADHVIIDIAPSSSGYAVSTSQASGKITVNVTPGGPIAPTPQGALVFTVMSDGSVSNPPPPPPSGSDAGTSGTGSDAGSSTGPGSGGNPPPNDAGNGSTGGKGHSNGNSNGGC